MNNLFKFNAVRFPRNPEEPHFLLKSGFHENHKVFPQQLAGYSYCAAKDEKYYGFEGHLIISSQGIITGATFADASIDERDIVQDMTDDISGLLIGDKGYSRPVLSEELAK